MFYNCCLMIYREQISPSYSYQQSFLDKKFSFYSLNLKLLLFFKFINKRRIKFINNINKLI
ncbi:hypothetical protein Mgra_00009203 [Meloidogyne graminicola]|uniref:Uncharacterized protein n=1 Tax=Meloidogyne graminicola TaxID=189291 RepID=A0A8S9ZDM3_9BILA|nr:hypothetical protein Mgra_00009203 [Meloidogyne graminicola]